MAEDIEAPATLPAGHRIYAIGDVHGCVTRLIAMHAAIRADLLARPVAAPLLIHLGDYIDRGPDSAGAVGLLSAGPPIEGVPTVNLMGNHEAMMLAAIGTASPDAVNLWLNNGGVPSLESWNVPDQAEPAEWAAHIPAPHQAWLRGLMLTHRVGDYLFVHAGVQPGLPLADQTADRLLWIREPFLSWADVLVPGDEQLVVVHGHTPTQTPVVRPNRIGVDTGAVMGGRLTCAILEGKTVRFLQQ